MIVVTVSRNIGWNGLAWFVSYTQSTPTHSNDVALKLQTAPVVRLPSRVLQQPERPLRPPPQLDRAFRVPRNRHDDVDVRAQQRSLVVRRPARIRPSVPVVHRNVLLALRQRRLFRRRALAVLVVAVLGAVLGLLDFLGRFLFLGFRGIIALRGVLAVLGLLALLLDRRPLLPDSAVARVSRLVRLQDPLNDLQIRVQHRPRLDAPHVWVRDGRRVRIRVDTSLEEHAHVSAVSFYHVGKLTCRCLHAAPTTSFSISSATRRCRT